MHLKHYPKLFPTDKASSPCQEVAKRLSRIDKGYLLINLSLTLQAVHRIY